MKWGQTLMGKVGLSWGAGDLTQVSFTQLRFHTRFLDRDLTTFPIQGLLLVYQVFSLYTFLFVSLEDICRNVVLSFMPYLSRT